MGFETKPIPSVSRQLLARGWVGVLPQPVRRDVSFGAVEEAGDRRAVILQGGASDAGEVAGVEVGVVGDGGGMYGEEEQQGARSSVAENLDELQSWVDREIARAALRGAVGTGCAEGAALLEDAGAEGFGVGEKGCDFAGGCRRGGIRG